MPWTSTLRPHDVVAVIMGGGAGNPAVSADQGPRQAGGAAGREVSAWSTSPSATASTPTCDRIFLLTQFNSGSLHRHIRRAYQFDTFSPGFVEILAAEQTIEPPTGIRAPPTRSARTCSTSIHMPAAWFSSCRATSSTA